MSIMGMWNKRIKKDMWQQKPKMWQERLDEPRACFCIGPQDGEPLCPCMMRNRQRERDNMRQEILEEIEAEKKLK